MLQEAALKDVLGPAGEPDEELLVPPHVRYVVGMLAPRRRRDGLESPEPDAEADADAMPPILHDELADGGRPVPADYSR